MKAGRKTQILTEGELPIMKVLWNNGAMFVRQIVEQYPDPRPHPNTVSTMLKILEEKGHVGHKQIGNSYIYHAVTKKEDVGERSLNALIGNFFDNSYKSFVSTLVNNERLTLDELKEIIELIEQERENG